MNRKPFVLCLINGMGIEDAKSYNIYNNDVMPTLDAFTNRYLFNTLNSCGHGVGLSEAASATRDIGYLNIGALSTVKQSIEIINSKMEDKSFFANEKIKNAIDFAVNGDSRIHFISLIGNKYGDDSVAHLRKMVEHCNSVGIKNIYLHLYLGANNNSLNKTFMKYTAAIHRILNLYPNVKVGIVAGVKYLKDSSGITITKDLYKVTVGGIGEHWINYNDAVESNYKRKNLEENIVPFIVNADGLIKNNDSVLVFNYENDLGSVYADLLIQPAKYMYTDNHDINIKVTSLFPLNNDTSVSCFEYEKVSSSFYGYLNQNGIKHVLIAEKEKIPYINYYFNGCNNTQATQVLAIESTISDDYDNNIAMRFQATTNKLIEVINSDFYDLIIVDFSIVDDNKSRNTLNIKNSLSALDNSLNQIYKHIINKDGIMYITSSYGLNEVIYNEKDELVSVDFSKKVPFIVIDNQLEREKYLLNSGNLCDIGVTVLNTLGIDVSGYAEGKNLLVSRNTSGKKKNNKLIIILVVFIILIFGLIFGLYYMGLI